MTNATCGRTSGKPFAYFDQESLSLKMSQPTLFADSQPFSGTVPKMGCLFNGSLSVLPKPVPLIDVKDCSSLLPTTTARDYKGIAFNPADLSRLVNALVWLTGYRVGSSGESTQKP
jgi:hypothetical protein